MTMWVIQDTQVGVDYYYGTLGLGHFRDVIVYSDEEKEARGDVSNYCVASRWLEYDKAEEAYRKLYERNSLALTAIVARQLETAEEYRKLYERAEDMV